MYTLRDSDEGLCPKCAQELQLLTHKTMPDGYPAFLICFACRDVTEVAGDDGETVEYRRGRRKKFTRVKPKKDPKAQPTAKRRRLLDHQAAQRAEKGRKP